MLYPEYWGRGDATEMCVAGSQHVLRKAGLEDRGERSLPHPNYADGPRRWFERDAVDWLATYVDSGTRRPGAIAREA